MKNILKTLFIYILLSTSVTVLAYTDAERVAQALADRLSDALDFDNGRSNRVHAHTKLRRFEDNQPMWMMLYVQKNQNRNHPRYLAQGFKTGKRGYFTNVKTVTDRNTFYMRVGGPWSYKLSGIGVFKFYAKENYRNLKKRIVSSNDRPKMGNLNPRGLGSVKFCPGVSFYKNKNYIGTPFTLARCDVQPSKSYCIKGSDVTNTIVKKSGSFHFDGLIKSVHLYTGTNCNGPGVWYSWNKQHGTVSSISSNVKNKIKSVKIVFKPSRR